MKTSIYVIALLLMPTISNAYNYKRVEVGGTVEQRSQRGTVSASSGPITQTSTQPGALGLPWQLLWNSTDMPYGSNVVAIPGAITTTFSNVTTPGVDHLVTLYVPDGSGSNNGRLTWDALTGGLLASPGEIKWGNPDTNTAPYYRLICQVPETITSADYIRDYRLDFSSSVQFHSPGSITYVAVLFNCYGVYEISSTVSVNLKDETLNLSGVAGKPIRKETAVRIFADPGRVRLTVQNRYRNDLVVSFGEDFLREQTDITFATTGEKTIPFYVGVTNTAAGGRSYTVNLVANYI